MCFFPDRYGKIDFQVEKRQRVLFQVERRRFVSFFFANICV